MEAQWEEQGKIRKTDQESHQRKSPLMNGSVKNCHKSNKQIDRINIDAKIHSTYHLSKKKQHHARGVDCSLSMLPFPFGDETSPACQLFGPNWSLGS
jgi:hypothetical protein